MTFEAVTDPCITTGVLQAFPRVGPVLVHDVLVALRVDDVNSIAHREKEFIGAQRRYVSFGSRNPLKINLVKTVIKLSLSLLEKVPKKKTL